MVNRTFLAFIGEGGGGDDGEIFAVIVSHVNTKISIYKLNQSEKEWIPVNNLKDKMSFLSETVSFGAIAPRPQMSNKIYFPKFYGKSGVFYSLFTQKYHSYDGRFSGKEPYMVEDIATATWIQPNYPS